MSKPAHAPKPKKTIDLEQKIGELTADLQRVHADFVNYRRRSEEEQGQVMEIAKQAVLAKFLPIFDNLDRVTHHIPKDLADNAWVQGIQQVGKQAESIFTELGIERIAAKGQPFNPEFHEALHVEGEGETEIVAEEVQPGYKIGDQVLRPALVKVRKEPGHAE
ncbi:nucleotide exchange factor GrpE [Candidatus Microgenomates bacterium]|nr:nucleotide exchange factor GrpE [Candidatus Microgenomates bacterium]